MTRGIAVVVASAGLCALGVVSFWAISNSDSHAQIAPASGDSFETPWLNGFVPAAKAPAGVVPPSRMEPKVAEFMTVQHPDPALGFPQDIKVTMEWPTGQSKEYLLEVTADTDIMAIHDNPYAYDLRLQ